MTRPLCGQLHEYATSLLQHPLAVVCFGMMRLLRSIDTIKAVHFTRQLQAASEKVSFVCLSACPRF